METNICTVLCLDHSGSMAETDYPPDRFGAACDAGMEFVRQKVRMGRTADLVGIVGFGTTGEVVLQPTPVATRVVFEAAFRRMAVDGGTQFAAGLASVRDAFEGSSAGGLLREFGEWLFDRRRPRVVGFQRHVVFLSDGHPGDPGAAKREAKALKDAGVVIECVGIAASPAEVGEEILKAMASPDDRGDPRYRFISDRASLIRDFRAKAAGLRILGS